MDNNIELLIRASASTFTGAPPLLLLPIGHTTVDNTMRQNVVPLVQPVNFGRTMSVQIQMNVSLPANPIIVDPGAPNDDTPMGTQVQVSLITLSNLTFVLTF